MSMMLLLLIRMRLILMMLIMMSVMLTMYLSLQGLLLMMLFLCSLPVAYVVVGLKPSWHCGPFSDFQLMYHVFTHWLMEVMPQSLLPVLDYITSPGIIIPTLVRD